MEPPSTSDNDKPRPFRSKLIPYAAQIAKWRREDRTYAEISGLLREMGVIAHRDTINAFVLVRARGGDRVAVLPETAAAKAEDDHREPSPFAAPSPAVAAVPPPRLKDRKTRESELTAGLFQPPDPGEL